MIKALNYFLLLIFLSSSYVIINIESADAQSIKPDSISYRYWVYFKDKGQFKSSDKIEIGSNAYKIIVGQISEKAIERRKKVLPFDDVLTYDDLPVNQAYIDRISEFDVKINAVSKWLNGVSITTNKPVLDQIIKLDFVEKIEGVHFLEQMKFKYNKRANYIKYNIVDGDKLKYNYGYSFWQNRQINVPILHYCGVTGWNVTVGMCDDGFNWRNHQALNSRNVAGEYDWIFKDDSTQYQFSPNQFPEDKWDQDGHGTSTFSTIGGFYEGQLIGPAFDAQYYLSKTEDSRSETPVEEDYWLEGVEWMEAQGIEVLSSSLIYKPYDVPNNSYSYSDMDGKTTIVVRAAEHLAHLGVVVCNSMGNEHQTNPPSIVSPPDGDSVISVGAVDSAGVIANFSSNGPTSDGRMKPDVVAMGVDDWTAASESITLIDSAYSYASGTSFSCPLTAGVCALILSVHPELTPMQVKEALRMTANNKDNPNNVYGWGLINAYDAALYYGMIMSNKPELIKDADNIKISTYVLSKNYIEPQNVKIYYTVNSENNFDSVQMQLEEKLDDNNCGKYSVTIPSNSEMLKFYFNAIDLKSEVKSPFGAPERFFIVHLDNMQIQIY